MVMVPTTVTVWSFECDKCHIRYHTSYRSKRLAERAARDAGWLFSPRRHVCNNCLPGAQ